MSIWPLKSILSLLALTVSLAWMPQAEALVQVPLGGALYLTDEMVFLEDKSKNLTLEDVRAAKGWQQVSEKGFSKGYNNSAWWLKFDTLNPYKTGNWLLEVAYPVLDYLSVYIADETGGLRRLNLGDKLPFAQRPIEHRTFLVPLDLRPNQVVTIYLRIASSSSVQVPLVIWEHDQFLKAQSTESLLHGVIFGSLIIMALYNLLVYTVLRDRSYIYYVCYIFCLILFAGGLYGWNFRYFWPTATRWNDQSILFFLAGLVYFATLFCWTFLDVKTLKQKWVAIWFKVHIAVLPMFMAASLILPYEIVVRVLVPVGAVSCNVGLVSGVLAWRQGRPSAAVYTIAWGFLFAGGIVLALSKAGVIAQTLVTNYALQFGSVLETVLLSFALAQRINSERLLRLDAQNKLLELQVQTNVELEERVVARTHELEQVNKKLKDLSDTDQLSGLKNRRFFDVFLAKEFATSFRERTTIGILLIDIDNFKSINDTYGHTVGDQCIQAIAKQLPASVSRLTDVVARYGGEEFCIVLPHTDAAGALHVANRSLAAIREIHCPVDNAVIRFTCSIGCHTEVPSQLKGMKEFIDRADLALYEAKKTGKDKVVVYKKGV